MSKICHIEITNINAMPRVWREAISAKQNGYNVEVYGEGDCVERNGIKYIGFPKAKNRMDRIFSRSYKMVKMAIDSKPDIIQLHSPELLLYYHKIKRKKIKVIFDSHEFYKLQILEKAYIPKAFRTMIAKGYDLVETIICKKIDAVFYPCTVEGQNMFENKCKTTAKIENYSEDTINVECTQERIPRTAIYAGCLSYNRGLKTMIETTKIVDYTLLLCGTFGTKEDEEMVYEACNEGKVKYMGSLSREELFELYMKTSLGLSLLKPRGQYTRIDNLSTKMYEYMQCGMPIVFSNFPYANKINEEIHYGIGVNSEDVHEVALAIEKIFGDRELANQLGQNGKQAIERRFNWTKESLKILKIYDELVKK